MGLGEKHKTDPKQEPPAAWGVRDSGEGAGLREIGGTHWASRYVGR